MQQSWQSSSRPLKGAAPTDTCKHPQHKSCCGHKPSSALPTGFVVCYTVACNQSGQVCQEVRQEERSGANHSLHHLPPAATIHLQNKDLHIRIHNKKGKHQKDGGKNELKLIMYSVHVHVSEDESVGVERNQ